MPFLSRFSSTLRQAPHMGVPVLLLAILVVTLAGCGSTKVYTADKTMIYNGSLYNMAAVKQITSRVDGQLPDGSTVNMRQLDKKAIRDLFKKNPEVVVSTMVLMDGQELVYQRAQVEKSSQYDSMVKRFDRALNDIAKFMGDKKKTQLTLK